MLLAVCCNVDVVNGGLGEVFFFFWSMDLTFHLETLALFRILSASSLVVISYFLTIFPLRAYRLAGMSVLNLPVISKYSIGTNACISFSLS